MNPFRIDTPFHPFVKPRASGHLAVGDLHSLWWEETGPQDGAPVVVLHGGPGGGIKPYYRRLLDPSLHRGIFFDQRGCGRSTPSGSLVENTTQALVADMEALRTALGIDRWTVVGGSWGSTLALAYAQAHPERVSALVVTGVFLAGPDDIHWLWGGARAVFPEVFAARDAWLTPSERADPRAAFRRRILEGDPSNAAAAGRILGAVEGQTLDLYPPDPPEDQDACDKNAAIGSRIAAWYDAHDYFLRPEQLLKDADRLAGIPGAVIAGRSDMCTPPIGAWKLAQAWPDARLTIVAAAGHRWSDVHLGSVLVPEIARLAGGDAA